MMETQMRDYGGGGRSEVEAGAGFVKRGIKREASESSGSHGDLERFEKRLRMLSLRNGSDKSSLYMPVNNASTESTSNGLSHALHSKADANHESMQVDDTRDRVYIYDLDKELEDISPDDGEEKLIFLPDIEKHFSKLPHQVLAGGGQDGSRELILYSVPKSLSVDAEHDSVRRAIIESRHRARERVAEEARQTEINGDHGFAPLMLPAPLQTHAEYDEDAMDIG